MLRNAHSAVKRTPFWLHRRSGGTSLSLDSYDSERIRRIRICGSSLFSMGDYRETGMVFSETDGTSYSLKLRLGPRNLLDYDEFVYSLQDKIEDATINYRNGTVTAIFSSYQFTTPVIDSTVMRLKPNTVYTFTAHLSYQTTPSSPASTGFTFLYSDGTTEEILYTGKVSLYNEVCVASRKGKTLSALCMNRPVGTNRIYYTATRFGFYEGDLSGEDLSEEVYGEAQYVTIPMDAPLRGIGYASDMIELTEGRYIRNVEYVSYSSAEGFAETDMPNVFTKRLPAPVRDDLAVLCPSGLLNHDGDSTGFEWVRIGEDMQSFYLHVPDCPTLADLDRRLSERSFGIAYALAVPVEKHFNSHFNDAEGKLSLSIDVSYPPFLFYVEYI